MLLSAAGQQFSLDCALGERNPEKNTKFNGIVSLKIEHTECDTIGDQGVLASGKFLRRVLSMY